MFFFLFRLEVRMEFIMRTYKETKSFLGTSKRKFRNVSNMMSWLGRSSRIEKTSGEVKNLFQFATHSVLNELILNMISLKHKNQ